MTDPRPADPIESTAPAGAGDRPALAAWHAGWAVAAALLALGGRWIGGIEGPVFYGVLAMAMRLFNEKGPGGPGGQP